MLCGPFDKKLIWLDVGYGSEVTVRKDVTDDPRDGVPIWLIATIVIASAVALLAALFLLRGRGRGPRSD